MDNVALYGHWICPFATRPGVEWSPEQTEEIVGRFEAFRRKRRLNGGSSVRRDAAGDCATDPNATPSPHRRGNA